MCLVHQESVVPPHFCYCGSHCIEGYFHIVVSSKYEFSLIVFIWTFLEVKSEGAVRNFEKNPLELPNVSWR